jgi:hypothetical protein
MGFLSRMKDAQQEAMANAGAGGGMGGMRMSDMSGQAAYAQTAQKLARQGVEAPGIVHTVRHTVEKEFGGSEKIEFDVSIRPAGGEPYQTTIKQSMLPAQLEGLSEGSAITVKYDPDAPQMALIYGW